MSAPILYPGMDVHKDSITVAVFGPTGAEPRLLEKLPCDLHKLFVRIAARKGAPIAAVAVARELVGFLWAVLQEVELSGAAQPQAA